MQNYRCDHIHLKSSNVDETIKWYCNIFSAEITFEGEFRGSKVYYLDINGMTFIVFGKLEGEEDPVPGTLKAKYGVEHFGFEVEDMDKAIKELKDKKVNILEEPVTVRPGQRIAYVEGPDRVRIELTERN